jgi:hypothetical protein
MQKFTKNPFEVDVKANAIKNVEQNVIMRLKNHRHKSFEPSEHKTISSYLEYLQERSSSHSRSIEVPQTVPSKKASSKLLIGNRMSSKLFPIQIVENNKSQRSSSSLADSKLDQSDASISAEMNEALDLPSPSSKFGDSKTATPITKVTPTYFTPKGGVLKKGGQAVTLEKKSVQI